MKSRYVGFYLVLILSLLTCLGQAQSSIEGKIIDKKTKESLPFVHMISDRAKAVSDIEGNYTLQIAENASLGDSITLSLIGYEKYTVSLRDLVNEPKVEMIRAAQKLQAVTILATEDPAYAMIRKAVKNRKENDPEKLPKFRYSAHNKAYVDVDRSNDTIRQALDSSNFANAHFMMLESVTRVTFEQPNKLKEEVLANQITGFSNPMFSLQSNTFQPFSSYSTYLTFIDFDFLNPISPGSEGRYVFQLEDSVDTPEGKSYIISFFPKKNASGNLLRGSLSLDADDWAIVTIQAKNAGDYNLAGFEIRQQYGKTSGKWFPEQSSSRYDMKDSEIPMLIVSNTYIDSVRYDFEKTDFDIANIEITTEANQRSTEEWDRLRQVGLSEEEANTFSVYDTLDTKILNSLDWFMAQSGSLSRGRLSLGKADILLPRLLGFNQYEGLRLGIGLAMSDEFIKWLSPEAYFAYGFRDKEIKYGGGLRFRLQPKRGLELFVGYENDVDEPGRDWNENMGGFTRIGEVERDLFIRYMNPYEAYLAELSYRPLRGVRTTARFKNERRTFERTNRTDASFAEYDLTTTELGLLIEFHPGENLMLVDRNLVPQGVSYPRFSAEISRALGDVLEGEQEYTKIELKMMHELKIPKLGPLQLFATGGKIWADEINQANLMLSRGLRGERDLGLVGFGFFHTMPAYAFINDQYVHAGLSQSFGNPFGLEWSFSRPEIRVMYQAAIGNLEAMTTFIPDMPTAVMDRAYLEGGLIIDNILRLKGSLYYSGLGLGLFYRHGYYESSNFDDNLAIAASFVLSF
jgi:hypothetical protein